MDTTRPSTFNEPLARLDPIYHSILVMRCPTGCTHNLLLTTSDDADCHYFADQIALALARGGTPAMVSERVAWFPHQDMSVRHPGYAQLVANMLRDMDAAAEDDLPY